MSLWHGARKRCAQEEVFMLPPWVQGAAARDMQSRAAQALGPNKEASSPSSSGLLSFLGVVLIALGTFAATVESLGAIAGAMLGLLVGVLAFLVAYRTRGRLGAVVGGIFAAASAYALHMFSTGSGGASWSWDIVVFVVVGLDQWAYRSR